jgi:hypothetical protein
MDKLLISIYVLYLEKSFDLLIPINISVKDAISLIQSSIKELSNNAYEVNVNAVLFDEVGRVINENNIVKFSGLKNGSKVMLV